MFIAPAWYIAAESAELGQAPLGRMLLGQPLVLFRRADGGGVVALEDRCCHRRAPLHRGQPVGDRIRCGYHGFEFAPDGRCVHVPGQAQVPPNAAVRSYPVCERYRWVWVWMGAPEDADPALIPDFGASTDPGRSAVSARMAVAGNYLLLVDNLLDLSHVGFVHAGTIGSDDTAAQLEWTQEGGTVRGVRYSEDIATPPHNLKQGFAPRSSQRKLMVFIPPCHIILDITTTERKSDGAVPRSMHIVLFNSITPESERSCHYFWASTRDFAVGDAAVDAFFLGTTTRAFEEDKDMIEAQQKIIDLDPEAPVVSVRADLGGLQARRLVAQLSARGAAGRGAQ
jgi:phenylpropionate dioxygenase-like ring-hydroxylating dioxygenase large terminal subunit